jgi:hypothetical protein
MTIFLSDYQTFLIHVQSAIAVYEYTHTYI